MSDVGTEDRDLSVDTGLRSHIEASVAHHAPSPDVTSAVNGAVEEHARNIRDRNDRERNAKEANGSTPDLKNIKPADRLRATIRAAVQDARAKAASASPDQKFVQDGPQKFMHNQPPGPWDAEAKAEWNNLPEKVRLAILREENENLRAFGPIASKYAEIEKAIAPHRDVIPKHISEPAAINELFNWYRALQSPQHKATALAVLMNQTGTTLQDIYNVVAQAQQQTQQYQQPQQYEQSQQVASVDAHAEVFQKLTKFSQDKPYFQAVRQTMGMILSAHGERYLRPDGDTDLDKLYQEACKIEGYSNNKNNKRAAAVSPSGRSPSGAPINNEKGLGIRASIKRAIAESRGII